MGKLWIKSTALVLVLVFIVSQSAFASTTYIYLGTRTRGAASIQDYYWGSTTGSASGYNYKSDLDAAIPLWNGISSQVNVTVTTDGPARDYFLVTTSQTLDNYATTFPYNTNYTSTGLSNDWYYCSVSLYDNVMQSLTSSEKRSVITHETGHTLKLRHPSPDETTNSIMSAYGFPTAPTADDKATLKYKWGN